MNSDDLNFFHREHSEFLVKTLIRGVEKTRNNIHMHKTYKSRKTRVMFEDTFTDKKYWKSISAHVCNENSFYHNIFICVI